MIQIAMVFVTIGLIVLGCKGFTSAGLQVSRQTVLRGKAGKTVGVICIVFGICFIPLVLLISHIYTRLLGF